MKSWRVLGGATAGAVLLALSSFAGVKQAQTVSLKSGWNAVYITVAPDESPDEVFGAWPVGWVAAYDPAAFLETKQYSGFDSTEGTRQAGFVMWRRADGPLSELKRIAANWVYVCFSTNAAGAAAYSDTLYGRPSAPRITWHPSSTNEPMNLVGFSLAQDATTTLGEYLDGADIGNVTFQRFYRQQGGNLEQPSLSPVSSAEPFRNGEVVVMTCSKVSDWSGVLNVSPMGGLDFSTNVNFRTLKVRNDGAKARTVSVVLDSGDSPTGTRPLPPEGLLVRDGVSSTNEWREFRAGSEYAFAKTIAAGETLVLEVALDRTKLATAAGTYYGGLLTVKDADGGSKMRVTLPVEVTSDGGASSSKAWPKGTWLTAGEFDTVTFLNGTTSRDVKSGGKMKVRIPLYVEYDGNMKLLQRFIHGVDTNGLTHVYSAAVEDDFPVAIGNAKRVSSAVLPIEAPVIGATGGTFGAAAEFGFAVGEDSKVNPYRHPFHPSHDGLRWDFETPTPSGDNIRNYVSTVKPELFSVTNRISFAWDPSTGSKWTPEETLSGDLTWELDGVRHEGTIRMKGRFTMTRISDCDLDK